MNIPILYHSILILMATIYPTSIPQIMLSFARKYRKSNQEATYLISCIFISFVLLLISCALVPISKNIIFTTNFFWYGIAVLFAPILIIVEIIIGALILKAKKTKIKGFSINASFVNVSNFIFVLTILYGIIEELIYRQLWSVAILDNLGCGTIVFIILSSVVYGFNHLYYGVSTFTQKTISGAFYAGLFMISGQCIIIPIITHGLQNLIIMIIGRYRKNE